MTVFEFHSGPHHDVHVINPRGSVAICTQWTPPETFIKKVNAERPGWLRSYGCPVAVVGTLRGPAGLPAMLRNLHYNPQIGTVLVWGKQYDYPMGEVLEAFFSGDAFQAGHARVYRYPDGRLQTLQPVMLYKREGWKGSVTLDPLMRSDMFRDHWADPGARSVVTFDLGKVYSVSKILEYLDRPRECSEEDDYWAESMTPHRRDTTPPLVLPATTSYPSHDRGFVVRGDDVVSVWQQLVTRVLRFGREVNFAGGKQRRELRNVMAVISAEGACPDEEEREDAAEYGRRMWYGAPAEDGQKYSYGERLVEGNLWRIAHYVRDHPLDSRRGWISLWWNELDGPGEEESAAPCFVSCFFRPDGDRIHLDATFRSHNLARAWKMNCRGLFEVLRNFCGEASSSDWIFYPGVLTVVSHSLTLNPLEIPALSEMPTLAMGFTHDAQGAVRFYRDDEGIHADHLTEDGQVMDTYHWPLFATATQIRRDLVDNMVVSDLGHAMYLGGEVEKILRGSGVSM